MQGVNQVGRQAHRNTQLGFLVVALIYMWWGLLSFLLKICVIVNHTHSGGWEVRRSMPCISA